MAASPHWESDAYVIAYSNSHVFTSWITIVWSMAAAACLSLAGLHLFVWSRQRKALGNLLFSVSTISMAGMAACELWMMRAETPAEFGVALRWLHVPAWVMILSLVGFVRVYLRAGRPWLAWTVCGVRTLSLILNFVFTPNLNYREITGLRQIPFLGESVAVAEGVTNPWMLVGQASLVLLVVFAVDAAVTVWRRDDRRGATLVCGSIVFFVFLGTVQAIVSLWGIVHTPLTPSLFYLGIIASMAYELSDELLRAAKVSHELRESEQRAEIAADAAGLGLWVWEFARDEIWATPRCRSILGFRSDERITFAGLLTRVHVDDRDATERRVRLAVERCESYEGEYRLALPTDSERWIGTTGRVQCKESGAAWRMHSVIREITERHRAQKEAALLRQEIAHVGRVSMMGQLAAALAHEINQPLGAILRNAEAAELFLQDASPDLGEIRAILADIRADDQRAGAVIERMRAMLKGHALETRTLDVTDLLEEVARLTRGDATARKVRLDVDVPNGLRPVRGDRVHLQQVLLNLILNSMDALSDAGPQDRRVALHARRNDEQTIEIAVRDWGPGIPAERLAHVFDPFFTTKTTGMGMGLPISRTIIEAHGGELWATNNEDRGATFHFTLQTAEEARDEGRGARERAMR